VKRHIKYLLAEFKALGWRALLVNRLYPLGDVRRYGAK
jgi:hypothetical protein